VGEVTDAAILSDESPLMFHRGGYPRLLTPT